MDELIGRVFRPRTRWLHSSPCTCRVHPNTERYISFEAHFLTTGSNPYLTPDRSTQPEQQPTARSTARRLCVVKSGTPVYSRYAFHAGTFAWAGANFSMHLAL